LHQQAATLFVYDYSSSSSSSSSSLLLRLSLPTVKDEPQRHARLYASLVPPSSLPRPRSSSSSSSFSTTFKHKEGGEEDENADEEEEEEEEEEVWRLRKERRREGKAQAAITERGRRTGGGKEAGKLGAVEGVRFVDEVRKEGGRGGREGGKKAQKYFL